MATTIVINRYKFNKKVTNMDDMAIYEVKLSGYYKSLHLINEQIHMFGNEMKITHPAAGTYKSEIDMPVSEVIKKVGEAINASKFGIFTITLAAVAEDSVTIQVKNQQNSLGVVSITGEENKVLCDCLQSEGYSVRSPFDFPGKMFVARNNLTPSEALLILILDEYAERLKKINI